jgi:hypothetical protein
MKYDICVVGGGAAGLSAAVSAARSGLSVIVIEKNKKIGNKIYATGNGKCNLSNVNIDARLHYNSEDNEYAGYLQNLYFDGHTDKAGTNINGKPYMRQDVPVYNKLVSFFENIGLGVYADTGGYIYPCSNQASAVVWSMKDALDSHGVKIIVNARVTKICRLNDDFSISYTLNSDEQKSVSSKYVLLACGGNSYAKLGGSTCGYELAKAMGHSVTDIYPALCGLKTDSGLHDADGVRVKTTARLLVNDEMVDEAFGEVQITAYGLSGISIFNLSSKAVRHLKNRDRVYVSMNLIENIIADNMSYDGYRSKYEKKYTNVTVNEEIIALVEYLKSSDNNRTILGALNGIVNEKLALYAIKRQELSPKEKLENISSGKLTEVLRELACYKCPVTGTNDFDMAQVTAGGVKLSEMNMESFESRLVPGLYIAGEMLDIDGVCGGYNITFALMSGITAAEDMRERMNIES